MAGWVISKGAASSMTVASPLARRARMARRVGSAKAEKAALRSGLVFIMYILYKQIVMVCQEENVSATLVRTGNRVCLRMAVCEGLRCRVKKYRSVGGSGWCGRYRAPARMPVLL